MRSGDPPLLKDECLALRLQGNDAEVLGLKD